MSGGRSYKHRSSSLSPLLFHRETGVHSSSCLSELVGKSSLWVGRVQIMKRT